MLVGVNVPVPLVLHIPPVATKILPDKITFELLEQIVWSGPAFTTGPGVTVMINVSTAATHPPLFVEVRIIIIGVFNVSPLLGV